MDVIQADRPDQDLCKLFRGTHRGHGRRRIIDRHNSDLEFLRYGRIVVGGGELAFDTGGEEMALFCVNGDGAVIADGTEYRLGRYDALYVPLGTQVVVRAEAAFDLVEVAAPVTRRFPVALVRFEDVLKDDALAKTAGFPPYARRLHTVIGENVPASRVLCGVTFSEDGNWTSWPPHEHSAEKEEIYLYVDMPEPQFGIHLNYTDFHKMAMCEPVWEGDAVAIKNGYHYNVATPGTRIGFVWMMAAVREVEDRVFSVVHVQPEFAGGRFKLF